MYPNILIIIPQLIIESVTSASASSLSTIQFMYLYRTASVMPWILFKIYFNYLNAEVLQENAAVLSILHSLKTFLNQYTVILVSSPSGGCDDEVVGNWTNHHGYKYEVYFLDHTWAAIHFTNHEGLFRIIRTIFNIYIF